jgi:hypothetical protein
VPAARCPESRVSAAREAPRDWRQNTNPSRAVPIPFVIPQATRRFFRYLALFSRKLPVVCPRGLVPLHNDYNSGGARMGALQPEVRLFTL